MFERPRAGLIGFVVVLAGLPAAAVATSSSAGADTPIYFVVMGDSIAQGVGSSDVSKNFAHQIQQRELASYPGLEIVDFTGCSTGPTGESAHTMLNGPYTCSGPNQQQGDPKLPSQLAGAEAFLQQHVGQIAFLAIDIGAPKGTPVLAAADGQIEQIRRENRGGNSLYQKDATGKYLLYYCHLSRYVKGIRPGDKVKKGDVIAYVGATGHVIGGSHLHFSITRLPEDDDNFKAGIAINPYLLFLAAVP